jgi:hypothetical protein
MAFRSASIDIVRENGRLLFRFSAADGPVSAIMLSVVKAEPSSPIEPEWLLMPAGGVIRSFPYTLANSQPEHVQPLGDSLGVGAADEAEQRILTSQQNHVLSDVVYGEVPSGFQQAAPATGPARELEAGVTYVVVVLGACHGQATFRI